MCSTRASVVDGEEDESDLRKTATQLELNQVLAAVPCAAGCALNVNFGNAGKGFGGAGVRADVQGLFR